MYIKVKIKDPLMKSFLLPLPCGASSVTKVIDGSKLELKEIDYAHLVESCHGSSKVSLEIIDAKEFKEPK